VDSLLIARHPETDDFSDLTGKLYEIPQKGVLGYDLRCADLTSCNLLNDYDKLNKATFDSKTLWPDNLPVGFIPDKIMELNKNPGLNIKRLHQKGITGKGVGIGIIDQALLVDHIEYNNQLKYYIERNTVNTHKASFHGAAVASIAVGKNVGAAPDADLFYISEDFNLVKYNNSILAASINNLLNINKYIISENRIRVISISWGDELIDAKGKDELNAAYKRARDEGVLLLTTSFSRRENLEFFGLDKNPMSDPDDFNSYTANLYGETKRYNISVPMNYRCIASPTGNTDYVVYSNGGKSWAAPYVAGVYALACQVKPDITYEEFWRTAAETSRTIYNPNSGMRNNASYIVDPVALILKMQQNS
jgi:subtilisin family serine protease